MKKNVLKMPDFAHFRTDLIRFWPILEVDGQILRGGVKSENKFCFIKYPFRVMSPTLDRSVVIVLGL